MTKWISRASVLRIIDADPVYSDVFNEKTYMAEQINNLPVKEEARPRGEWIFHKYDKNYECSNCHIRFDQTQVYTEKRFENALWAKMEIYKFCPNCGASMSANDEQVTGKLKQPCPCDTCQTAIDRCGCQMHLCSQYQKWKEGEAE